MKRIYTGFLAVFALYIQVWAQVSVDTLSESAYLNAVISSHPKAVMAALLPEIEAAKLSQARGAFDPKFQSSFREKRLKDESYYVYRTHELKVPTISGIAAKAGADNVSGSKANPENNTPADNLPYMGVEVPLGRNMIFPTDRIELQKAKQAVGIQVSEQTLQENLLLKEAAEAYWTWWLAEETARINQKGLTFASQRFRFVKEQVTIKENAPIDTIEAAIEVRKRNITYQRSLLNAKNTFSFVEGFLWQGDNEEFHFTDLPAPGITTALPGNVVIPDCTAIVNFLRENHPKIAQIKLKQRQLKADRKLASNNLLPAGSISANTYFSNNTLSDAVDIGHIGSNYKIEASISVPLFLRKERGKLREIRLKEQYTELDLSNQTRQLMIEALNLQRELMLLEQQIELQRQLLQDVTDLRDAEEVLFKNGESSLFKVNQRERYLLEVEILLASYRAKYALVFYKYFYSIGYPMKNLLGDQAR